MGLFDKDLIEQDPIHPFTSGVKPSKHRYSNILLAKIEKNGVVLSDDEETAINSFYENNLSGDGVFHLIHLLNERNGVVVSLSQNEESNSGIPDYPINPYKMNDGRIVLLGKYIPHEDKIVLFVNTIRAVAMDFDFGPQGRKIQSADLLLYVLTHELYHGLLP